MNQSHKENRKANRARRIIRKIKEARLADQAAAIKVNASKLD